MRTVIKESAIAVILVFVLAQFVRPVTVMGRSMEPNFQNGDNILVSKVAYRTEIPKRGDVIVFKSKLLDEKGNPELLVKRVVALPGEEVYIEKGHLFVNGHELVDNVSKEGMGDYNMDPTVIPTNAYFCLGDNRMHSTDSRTDSVGNIQLDDIVGKAIYRWYPLADIGAIQSLI